MASPRAHGEARRELELAAHVMLDRHPAVGFAIGLVRAGRSAVFVNHGLADVAAGTPVTQDTVFRIASITKLFTAIALAQLWEQGRIDLDAPAAEYLRAFALRPASPRFRPATVRQLLTHTAGVPEVLHLGDMAHPSWGPFMARPAQASVPMGQRLPSLATYYRDGLPVTAEPGLAFRYSNHGFAALGQIVEDVSGVPYARYVADHVFAPLGMDRTALARPDLPGVDVASGYVIGRGGPTPVPERDWICAAAGGIYSTPRDQARFIAALLGGGANEHGRILAPATLTMMLEPHFRPDPRLPGRGLAFVRGEIAGHRVVGHDGILPGFDSDMVVAPDDGVGLIAMTNGSVGAHTWLAVELDRLLRRLLGAPDDAIATDIAQRPETWPDLCGRYGLPAGSDLRARVAAAGGVEVRIDEGRLALRVRTPIPPLWRGFQLHPDDPVDPNVFRIDPTAFGMSTVRAVFGRDAQARVEALYVDLPGQPLTLVRRTPSEGTRARSVAAVGALALAVALVRSRRTRSVVAGHR